MSINEGKIDSYSIKYSVGDFELASIENEKALWVVQVPKGGNFFINYTCELSLWQRFWMRFIGWSVERVG